MKPSKLFLGVVLLLSTLYAGASVKIGNLYYDLNASTKTASVAKGNSDIIGTAKIPENVTSDGVTYKVTAIGDYAFQNAKSLNSLNLGNVTSIGDYAFAGCSMLYTVSFPSSLVSIGDNAFDGSSTAEVYFYGSSLKSIGLWAFDNCSNLKKVFVEDLSNWCKVRFSVKSNPLSNPDAQLFVNDYGTIPTTEIVIPSGITEINDYTFCGAKSIQSVTIPEGVTSIGEKAFEDCSSLKTVTFPSTLKYIGEHSFSDCTSLKSLTIPEGVEVLGSRCFSHNYFSFLDIPSTVTPEDEDYSDLGCNVDTLVFRNSNYVDLSGWFYGKVNMMYVSDNVYDAYSNASGLYNTLGTISDFEATSYQTVGNLSFRLNSKTNEAVLNKATDNNLGDVVIPATVTKDGKAYPVTSIGELAFEECTSLTSVIIPDGVKSIGMGAFYKCKALSSVDIPNGVTTIGKVAFFDCIALTSVVIPNSVKVIDLWAFERCTALVSVELSNSIKEIEGGTFSDCTSLASVKIPVGVRTIGHGVFENCLSLKTIRIPEGVTSIDNEAFLNSKLELLEIPSTAEFEGSYNPLEKIDVDKLIYKGSEVVDFKTATRIDYLYVQDNVYEQYKQTSGYNNLRKISELAGYEDYKLGKSDITVVNGKIHFECEKEYDDVAYSFSDYECSFNSATAHSSEDINFPTFSITLTVNAIGSKDGIVVGIANKKLTFTPSSCGDINGDGVTTIADVTSLVNMILGK